MADDRYWMYRPATPVFSELPVGAFRGTQKQWEQFSPGMRREIVRDFNCRNLTFKFPWD